MTGPAPQMKAGIADQVWSIEELVAPANWIVPAFLTVLT